MSYCTLLDMSAAKTTRPAPPKPIIALLYDYTTYFNLFHPHNQVTPSAALQILWPKMRRSPKPKCMLQVCYLENPAIPHRMQDGSQSRPLHNRFPCCHQMFFDLPHPTLQCHTHHKAMGHASTPKESVPIMPPSPFYFVSSPHWPTSIWCPDESCLLASCPQLEFQLSKLAPIPIATPAEAGMPLPPNMLSSKCPSLAHFFPVF